MNREELFISLVQGENFNEFIPAFAMALMGFDVRLGDEKNSKPAPMPKNETQFRLAFEEIFKFLDTSILIKYTEERKDVIVLLDDHKFGHIFFTKENYGVAIRHISILDEAISQSRLPIERKR